MYHCHISIDNSIYLWRNSALFYTFSFFYIAKKNKFKKTLQNIIKARLLLGKGIETADLRNRSQRRDPLIRYPFRKGVVAKKEQKRETYCLGFLLCLKLSVIKRAQQL